MHTSDAGTTQTERDIAGRFCFANMRHKVTAALLSVRTTFALSRQKTFLLREWRMSEQGRREPMLDNSLER